MSTCEITQAQWEAVMGDNPSSFLGDDRPVENVTWDDVQGARPKTPKKAPTCPAYASIRPEVSWFSCQEWSEHDPRRLGRGRSLLSVPDRDSIALNSSVLRGSARSQFYLQDIELFKLSYSHRIL